MNSKQATQDEILLEDFHPRLNVLEKQSVLSIRSFA